MAQMMSTGRPEQVAHAAQLAMDLERNAYNAAFYELGLRWHWDQDTWLALQAVPAGRRRVRVYLETDQAHLLRAYDVDFLVDAIENKVQACRDSRSAHDSHRPCRFNWAEANAGQLGI